jgi:hypothetical protein
MGGLTFSGGWIVFIGGISGIVTVLRAKTFSWKNYSFIGSEEDRKEEVPMTLLRRSILLAICIGLAIWGGIWIQADHGWNPFTSGRGNPPASTS